MDIFKLLMTAGSEGMTTSELSEALEVRQNTMSTNLSVLLVAGLVHRSREGRSVRYFIAMSGIKRLMAYFLDECCGSSMDVYQPILDSFERI